MLVKSTQDCPTNGVNQELKKTSGTNTQNNPLIKTAACGISRIIHEAFNDFDSISDPEDSEWRERLGLEGSSVEGGVKCLDECLWVWLRVILFGEYIFVSK